MSQVRSLPGTPADTLRTRKIAQRFPNANSVAEFSLVQYSVVHLFPHREKTSHSMSSASNAMSHSSPLPAPQYPCRPPTPAAAKAAGVNPTKSPGALMVAACGAADPLTQPAEVGSVEEHPGHVQEVGRGNNRAEIGEAQSHLVSSPQNPCQDTAINPNGYNNTAIEINHDTNTAIKIIPNAHSSDEVKDEVKHEVKKDSGSEELKERHNCMPPVLFPVLHTHLVGHPSSCLQCHPKFAAAMGCANLPSQISGHVNLMPAFDSAPVLCNKLGNVTSASIFDKFPEHFGNLSNPVTKLPKGTAADISCKVPPTNVTHQFAKQICSANLAITHDCNLARKSTPEAHSMPAAIHATQESFSERVPVSALSSPAPSQATQGPLLGRAPVSASPSPSPSPSPSQATQGALHSVRVPGLVVDHDGGIILKVEEGVGSDTSPGNGRSGSS